MDIKGKKQKIPLDFYRREELFQIGKELLGCHLFTQFDGQLTGGIIVEIEVYKGSEDRASHAYDNKMTERTRVMFERGGVAYVYLCYGMHHLFNIVTGREGTPHAILVRSVLPVHGIEIMLKRRKKRSCSSSITSGPGMVTQALGIRTCHNGASLVSDRIWLEKGGIEIAAHHILTSPRIGVEYAGKDALLPWRFHLAENSGIT